MTQDFKQTKKLTIYSTSHCPYCDQAKRLFSQIGLKFDEIKLDDKPELRAKLSKDNAGWRTVPMIFVEQEFLGGFSDVKALHDKKLFLTKLV